VLGGNRFKVIFAVSPEVSRRELAEDSILHRVRPLRWLGVSCPLVISAMRPAQAIISAVLGSNRSPAADNFANGEAELFDLLEDVYD
jgi:hypothetical protein